MNVLNKVKLIYMYGEYEGDFNRLLKKDWLNQTEKTSALLEFETIKSDYEKLCKNFNFEESKQLIIRMKKMPIIGFTTKKEKFMVEVQNWISHFDFKRASKEVEKKQRSKNKLKNSEGTENSKKKIQFTEQMSIINDTNNSKVNDIKTKNDNSNKTKSEPIIPKSDNQHPSNYIENAYNLNMEMVFVKEGTFWMGAQSDSFGMRNYDKEAENKFESPVHKVTLSGFFIGKFVVTQKQWEAIMGTNPSTFKGKNYPVNNVSWIQAQNFIKKLNEKTKLNYRLPTEAEWEYAARGGNKSKGYIYSGSDSADKVGWTFYSENPLHSVGLKLPNELGLYDMTGNVLELCQDWFCAYEENPQTNPVGSKSRSSHFCCGAKVCLRGGSTFLEPQHSRNSFRFCDFPESESFLSGFRIVLPK